MCSQKNSCTMRSKIENLILLRILIVQKLWDFNVLRSEGTRRSVNLSSFLLRGLKAELCDFLGGKSPRRCSRSKN